MYIEKIEIEGFRNYENEKAEFHKNINIITGENAQGKTNLLESIYFTSFGKSFRTSKDREMIGFEKDYLRVSACYVDEEDEEERENMVIALARDGRKSAQINGRTVERISEIINNHYAVIFSPEDLKIVKDEPERRRNFIDSEICQLSFSYFNALSKYKKILLQRNMYLKERNIDENLLEVWDENLSEEGARIIVKRKEFIDRLSLISNKIHSNITDGKENPTTVYESNIPLIGSKDEIKEEFLLCLTNARERDIQMGNTSRGPHKDDIDIRIKDKSTRKFASQGQQRTVALSLKLAEIELIKEEKGQYPILLLDDVFSELDEGRQRYLVDYLDMMQVFITAAEVPEKIIKYFPDSKKITVKEGHIKDY